jgi:hypothetical protein
MQNQEMQERLSQIDLLLEEYKGLVEQCESWYAETSDEFMDDVYVRTKIHVLIGYLDLDKEPAFATVMQELTALDDRFKAILMPDTYLDNADKHWWNGRVLKFAQDEYQEMMLGEHGIEVGEA